MSTNPSNLRDPKVFITGHDTNGNAIVRPETSLSWGVLDEGRAAIAPVYSTSEIPVNLLNDEDITQNTNVIANPALPIVYPSGTILRYMDLAPGNTEFMHRTISVDYVICVQGELELVLDSGETRVMRAGDIVIQRGTMHSWRNPGKEWARLVASMMPATGVVGGGKALEEDLSAFSAH